MKRYIEDTPERRRYVRLETVFPIEFQLYSKEKKETISGLRQGFTRDINEIGMCIVVNELENGFLHKLEESDTELILYINIPNHKEPIETRAKLRWSRKLKEEFPARYLIGVEYMHIPESIRRRIIGHARKLRRRSRLIVASILLLIGVCSFLLWYVHNIGARKGIIEKKLLSLEKAFVQAEEKRVFLENEISAMSTRRQQLEGDVANSQEEIGLLETELNKMVSEGAELSNGLLAERRNLEEELNRWQDQVKFLTEQIEELSVSKEKLNKELTELKKLDEALVVKVRLTNGNTIVGQLLDLDEDRLDIKVGLGSIGIARRTIASVEEVGVAEKIDIQKRWQYEEEEARKLQAEMQGVRDKQRAEGLVYFNGKWVSEKEALAIKKELEKKETEVFKLIAGQRLAGLSSGKKPLLTEAISEKITKPVISIKDGRIYKDGGLFFIKGVGYGIEYPGTMGGEETFKKVPISVFRKDFQMIKEAGINTIRTYEPLPTKLLDLAEEFDIMVIENICYPCDNTDFNSKVHMDTLKDQIRKYVKRDRDRKCILMWSIWNDAPWPWGSEGNVVERYGKEKVDAFLKELYDTVKKYDVSHPVTAANAFGFTGDTLGFDFLDVIGFNLYIGGHDWFVEEDAKREIARVGEIKKTYNKPVVVLETGFSTFVEGQDQAEVLEKQIRIAGTNFAGITIFQWADGWNKAGNKDKQDASIEEYWGILDGYRRPKSGYKTVCRLFNVIETNGYGYSEETDEEQ